VIRLAVRVDRAHAEAALAELLVFSPDGLEEIEIDDGTVEYVLYGADGELPSLPALEASVGEALVAVRTSEIADDWPDRWREFHRPVAVGRRVHVRAPWHPPPAEPGLIDVIIDPGQAFGTGAHATSRLCIELLVGLERDGVAHGMLLDVGCGSGILAIAASKLGFQPVVALDNDPACIEATQANAAANGVVIETRAADLRSDPLPDADTIVANLLLAPLLELARRLEARPAHLIASGLLAEQGDQLARELDERAQLREAVRLREGDWLAMLFVAADPRVSSQGMSIIDDVKGDLATAMKAGDKERVGTLRLVLSELQKAAKEGSSDELAVLRRERKRRAEAERAFRDGGREDLAASEARESELIAGYLPAVLDDQQLREIVARAVTQSGASSPQELGKVMPIALAEVAGRADGKRVSEQVREALGGA
jgi:ribosomal protein L11 methyltransferase